MIAKRLSIQPILPKGGDKRLSLSKKQDKSNSSNTKIHLLTNNERFQIKQKTTESPNFRINRPGRFSMKNKGIPFHLIFQANEGIRQKNKQVRSRSLSTLLFGKNKLQLSQAILEDHKSQNFDQLTESTEIIDIFNILPKKQNPHKQKNQMFNFESFLQIKKNQTITEFIQQKIQLSVNQNFQENTNQNNQLKVKKQFRSIGISTDLEIGSDSYKQFLRFKISKKQKYNQLQNLFEFIQKLYKKQIKSFNQRQEQIKKLYEQNMSTQRQERIVQIMERTNQAQNDIKQYVKKTVNQIQNLSDKLLLQNKLEINKLQQEINNLRKDISQSNKRLSQNMDQKLYSNYEGYNQVVLNKVGTKNTNQFSDIYQRLSNMSKLVNRIEQKTIKTFRQEEQKLYDNLDDIQQTFDQWKQYSTKKNQMIQVCIDQLIRLPQMSMTIFGMNDAMIQEKQNLKKIGIFLDLIPQMDNFSKLHIQKELPPNIDKTFQSFLNKKCMNCCYLKSKMRYIYAKNQQIKPAIKILNSLLNVSAKQSL